MYRAWHGRPALQAGRAMITLVTAVGRAGRARPPSKSDRADDLDDACLRSQLSHCRAAKKL